MSGGTSTEHAATGRYLRLRAAVAGAVGLAFLVMSLMSRLELGAHGGDGSMRVVSPGTEAIEPVDGPPRTPMTAISVWWSERAADAYGSPDVVHLGGCDDASGLRTGQILLCSTLVEDLGATRVYDSGRVGAPADVRITVVEQPDGTWAVTETLAR